MVDTTMLKDKTKGFIVVEFQSPPKNSDVKYDCVPKRWIQCDMTAITAGDLKVAIVYPPEKESRVAVRVRYGEAADIAWQMYIVKVKTETALYGTALDFLKSIRLNSSSQEKKIKQVTEEINSKKSTAELNHPQILLKLLSKQLKVPEFNENRITVKPTLVINTPETSKIQIKQTKEEVPHSSEINKIIQKTDRNDSTPSTATKSHSINYEDLNSQIHHLFHDNVSLNTNNNQKQLNSQQINNNNISNNNNNSIPVEEFKKYAKIEKEVESSMFSNNYLSSADLQFLKDLQKEKLERPSNIVSALFCLKKLRKEVYNNKKTIHNILLKCQVNATTGPAEDHEKTNTVDSSEEPEEEIDTENVININLETVPTKDPRQIISDLTEKVVEVRMVRYDEIPHKKKRKINKKEKKVLKKKKCDDATWTLKHREPRDGLVELMKGTQIYVSAQGLAKCQKRCRSVTAFARALLFEIFTRKALGCCSLYGGRPLGGVCGIIRPPLHPVARTVLLRYAAEYGEAKSWTPVDHKLVVGSLRSKLHEWRKLMVKKHYSKQYDTTSKTIYK